MALPPPWIALCDAMTAVGIAPNTGDAHKGDGQRLRDELLRNGWDVVPEWAVSRWRMNLDLFGDERSRNAAIVDRLRTALETFDADQAVALDIGRDQGDDRVSKIVRTVQANALLATVLDLIETYGGSRVV